VKDRLFRGDDFEYERSRREDFDPIAEGKRNGLGAELSRTIWDHARREATSHHGLCDESLAREIFAQITKRIAEHDGQPGAAPGKTTQVDVVSAPSRPATCSPSGFPARPRGCWLLRRPMRVLGSVRFRVEPR